MHTVRVDVAVVGSGTAGLNARRQAERQGRRVVMIESGPYGTLCARVGCMPSKLLIAAAEAAHGVDEAGRFGVRVPDGVRVDGPAVLERVRRERDRFVGFVVRDTLAIPEAQRLRGRARFVAPGVLEVEPEAPGGEPVRVEARAVVLATGSTPVLPPPYDAIREHVMVSDDVFELEDLPRSLAVAGTGIVGLELGQALARLGVDVAFFNPDREVGPFRDPELQRVAREVLGEELVLHLGADVHEAQPVPGGVRLRWRSADGDDRDAVFERVLVAAGRRPALEDLDLAKAGAPPGEGGVPPWDPRTTQVADLPLFLAGDASGHRPLLHEASDEGRIAGANAAAFPDVETRERRTKLVVAFTDPQIGLVGASWDALDPGEVEVGEVSYADQGRARVAGANRGLVRLYARRRGCQLVGAEMLGPRVEHMAHLLAWAVQEGMTVQHALRMPFYHPVFEEGLRTALRELASKLEVTGECRCEDLADAPGS
ncbi:MAG: dihydrolipoyl dehydrogenase [Myxococcota bacterium]|nr:dihydrolipoyl dehydrogenase [Myxococcota bacterium]